MVKTPTYHVFDLYKEHQDATLVYSQIETASTGTETEQVPQISVSVSMDEQGVLHATLANLSDEEADLTELVFVNFVPTSVEGEVLCGKPADHNDFTAPDAVHLEPLTDVRVENGRVLARMPACSVVRLTIR